MPLLEKAWAKLIGTYSFALGIDAGLPNETLVFILLLLLFNIFHRSISQKRQAKVIVNCYSYNISFLKRRGPITIRRHKEPRQFFKAIR